MTKDKALERKAINARELGLDYETCCYGGIAHDCRADANCKIVKKIKAFTPTQRTWQGLTDKQYLEACQMAEAGNYMIAFQRIQQWLKENNA